MEKEEWDRINRLYDFYGQLLTEKQQRVFESYYQEDLSLGEIASLSGISRQGVHEHLQRAVEALEALEQKLSLFASYEVRQRLLREAMKLTETESLNRQALRRLIQQLLEMDG